MTILYDQYPVQKVEPFFKNAPLVDRRHLVQTWAWEISISGFCFIPVPTLIQINQACDIEQLGSHGIPIFHVTGHQTSSNPRRATKSCGFHLQPHTLGGMNTANCLGRFSKSFFATIFLTIENKMQVVWQFKELIQSLAVNHLHGFFENQGVLILPLFVGRARWKDSQLDRDHSPGWPSFMMLHEFRWLAVGNESWKTTRQTCWHGRC